MNEVVQLCKENSVSARTQHGVVLVFVKIYVVYFLKRNC